MCTVTSRSTASWKAVVKLGFSSQDAHTIVTLAAEEVLDRESLWQVQVSLPKEMAFLQILQKTSSCRLKSLVRP